MTTNPYETSLSAQGPRPGKAPGWGLIAVVTLLGAAAGGAAGWFAARNYDHLFIVRYFPPVEFIALCVLVGTLVGFLTGRIIARSLAAAHAFDLVEFNREELRQELEEAKARLRAARAHTANADSPHTANVSETAHPGDP